MDKMTVTTSQLAKMNSDLTRVLGDNPQLTNGSVLQLGDTTYEIAVSG